MKRQAVVLTALFFWTFTVGSVSAYDLSTHRALTRKAVSVSALDTRLKNLGFADSGATKLLGVPAEDWVRDGSAFEDQPAKRVVNHFHNPMKPWNLAGLTILGDQLGQSSVLWQQNPDQDGLLGLNGGTWSWPKARQLFITALTSSAAADREAAFAKTFRALGQLMHLVQDASVPAHARNDPHLYLEVLGRIIGTPDGYERWAEANVNSEVFRAALNAEPVRPGPAIFTGLSDLGAPVPVAGLIDTGRYGASRSAGILTETNIGIAEYTSGNFLSDSRNSLNDAKVLEDFPFPAPTSVDLGPLENAPRTGHLRRYFRKVRDGERVDHLAVPSALYNSLPAALRDRKVGLDDKVFQDYAGKLVPRAVGYSAALLDYFFRGRLTAQLDVHRGSSGPAATVTFTNLTPGEPMVGAFELYYDTPTGTRRLLGSWPLALNPDEPSQPFDLPALPADMPPSPWLLVFRGELGREPNAVAAAQVRVAFYGQMGHVHREFLPQGIVTDSGEPLGVFSFDPLDEGSTYALFATKGIARMRTWITVSSPSSVGTVFQVAERWTLIYHEAPIGSASHLMEIALNPPLTLCFGREDLSYNNHAFATEEPPWSVTAELVEFEPPPDLPTLFRYTIADPPVLRRRLLSVSSGDSGTVLVDLAGVRFFGFRVTTVLEDPGLPPLPEPLPFGVVARENRNRTCFAIPFARFRMSE